MFFTIVPEKSIKIIERFGKYHKTLRPGFNIFIPFLDRIAYWISEKEDAINIDNQSAITKDNVALQIDGVVFFKVVDPYKSAYGIDNYTRGT